MITGFIGISMVELEFTSHAHVYRDQYGYGYGYYNKKGFFNRRVKSIKKRVNKSIKDKVVVGN